MLLNSSGDIFKKIDDIPYNTDFYLFQYQGFAVDGTDVFVTEAPVGQDGNFPLFERKRSSGNDRASCSCSATE